MRPTALPRRLIPVTVSAQQLSMILTVPPGLTLSAPSQTQAMAEPRPLTLTLTPPRARTLTPPRATRPITWSKHLQVVLPYYFLLTYYLTILLTLLADLLSY